MNYVDGYILVVKRGRMAAYARMARWGARLWMKHGALEYYECVGDDLRPAIGGMPTGTFPKMTRAGPGESIVFSFIVFKSKTHRNAVNKRVMAEMKRDDRMGALPMPFDMKRFAYGGFSAIVAKQRVRAQEW